MSTPCSVSNVDLSRHDNEILDRIFNPNLPQSDVDESIKEEAHEAYSAEEEEVIRLEAEGVRFAEAGDVLAALEKLDNAVALLPHRASSYNNRAQARRLVHDNTGAMDDLSKAIELSDSKGKVACQAFTQRGLLLKLDGKDDEALEDFKKAASLGGIFAKQMAVSLNPYAAMCNQMLAEVIGKLQRGES